MDVPKDILLQTAIDDFSLADGFMLEDFPKGTLFEVQTVNALYTIGIINGKKGRVLVQEFRQFICPQICYLHGSVVVPGSSLIAAGKVGIGLYLEFRPLLGPLIISGRIVSIKQLDDKETFRLMHKMARGRFWEEVWEEVCSLFT